MFILLIFKFSNESNTCSLMFSIFDIFVLIENLFILLKPPSLFSAFPYDLAVSSSLILYFKQKRKIFSNSFFNFS